MITNRCLQVHGLSVPNPYHCATSLDGDIWSTLHCFNFAMVLNGVTTSGAHTHTNTHTHKTHTHTHKNKNTYTHTQALCLKGRQTLQATFSRLHRFRNYQISTGLTCEWYDRTSFVSPLTWLVRTQLPHLETFARKPWIWGNFTEEGQAFIKISRTGAKMPDEIALVL